LVDARGRKWYHRTKLIFKLKSCYMLAGEHANPWNVYFCPKFTA
jgi:hypothetical protein